VRGSVRVGAAVLEVDLGVEGRGEADGARLGLGEDVVQDELHVDGAVGEQPAEPVARQEVHERRVAHDRLGDDHDVLVHPAQHVLLTRHRHLIPVWPNKLW
jgi:hypothetical protein